MRKNKEKNILDNLSSSMGWEPIENKHETKNTIKKYITKTK
jgi:hypothetical protein